jgi:hypothetical protein
LVPEFQAQSSKSMSLEIKLSLYAQLRYLKKFATKSGFENASPAQS